MQQLAFASPSDVCWLVSRLFVPCRFVRGQDGVQIIIKDAACIQAIRRLHTAGSSGFNLVQRSLWPQTPFAHTSAEATEDVPDSADEPGAWSSNSMHASSHLQPAGSMANSMRVGRILRPVPAAAAINMQEVSPEALAVKAFATLQHTSLAVSTSFHMHSYCVACVSDADLALQLFCMCSSCLERAWSQLCHEHGLLHVVQD